MKLEMNETNTKIFGKLIGELSSIGNSLEFRSEGDNLRIDLWDDANVMATLTKINKDFFTNYEMGEEEKFAIESNKFKQIMKRINGQLTIIVDDNMKLQSGNKKFELPVEDIYQDRNIPELENETIIKIDTSILSEAVENTTIFTKDGSVRMDSIKDKLILESSDIMHKARQEIDIERACKTDEPFASKYSATYLTQLPNKIFNKVQINLGKDKPLILNYSDNGIALKVLLAPRVEND